MLMHPSKNEPKEEALIQLLEAHYQIKSPTKSKQLKIKKLSAA
jgi:hypothetical protein